MRHATQEEITLFALMGQALLNIQVLEECLNVSVTLKIDVGYPRKASMVEATELLNKRRKFTLGKAIKEAQKKDVYDYILQKGLNKFLNERNWLVHKSIDDIYKLNNRYELFQRIQYIALEAHRIQRSIEDDLIKFSESNGLDMSNVRDAMKNYRYTSEV